MQGDLFDSDPTIQERFEEFHAAHPDVYDLFVRFSLELKQSGRERYGARSIIERIRWHIATTSSNGEDFKINDNYISRYARKLMSEYPEFEGFFETRCLRSA